MIFHITRVISPYFLEAKTQRIYSLLRDDVKDNQPTRFNIPQESIREKKLGTGLYTPRQINPTCNLHFYFTLLVESQIVLFVEDQTDLHIYHRDKLF